MRGIVTDLLEILGLVLLVAAAGVWAWTVAPAAGLAACGVGLVAASALLVRLGKS
jgi:hypothetical protein